MKEMEAERKYSYLTGNERKCLQQAYDWQVELQELWMDKLESDRTNAPLALCFDEVAFDHFDSNSPKL